MSDDTIFRCFQPGNLRLINTEALKVDEEAFFLATHHPTRVSRLDQNLAVIPEDPGRPFTEERLLQEYLCGPDPFQFVLVRGATGAGKSHLIRWLFLRLKENNLPQTRLLLIRRSESNLREIIQKIIARLPGETLAEVEQRLKQAAQQYSGFGLRTVLLNRLAEDLDPNNFEDGSDPLAGLKGKERSAREYAVKHLPGLFYDEVFREHFNGEGNIIDALAAHTIGGIKPGTVREGPRLFTAADFLLPDALIDDKNRGAANKFARQLQVDKTGLREVAAEYVNERVPTSTQKLLNLQGHSFTDIFKEVRWQLRNQGEQLILLIEDVADVEFMHQQLLEVLIEQPTAERCPLKSAIGVSDGFLTRIPANIRERATLRVTLDVRAETTETYARQFAVGYLNALRTPLPQLQDRRPSEPDRPIPSACERCAFRKDCLPAFGAVGAEADAIGLFPLNGRSLWKMYQAKHGSHAGDFNPRVFLKEVLLPTLVEEYEAFAEKRFPGRAFWARFDNASLGGAIEATLRGRFGAGKEWQAAALHALWGQSLAPHVYETFGLRNPAVGADTVTAPPAPLPPPLVTALDPSRPPGEATSPPPAASVPDGTEGLPKNLQNALDQLAAYHSASGKVTQTPLQLIRAVVRTAVLSRLEWNLNWLREKDWDGLVSNEVFNLEKDGQEPDHGSDAQLRLVIPRRYPDCPGLEPATGLQGLLLVRYHGGWNFAHATQGAAFYLRHTSALLERLARELTDKITTSLGSTNLLVAAVELLALASRFQDDLDADSNDALTIRALFVRRQWPKDDAADPNRSWNALAQAFAAHHSGLLDRVKHGLNCAKGNAESFVLDISRVLAWLPQWRQRKGQLGEAVLKKVPALWSGLEKLRKSSEQHLAEAIKKEVTGWTAWLKDVDEQLGQEGVADLLEVAEKFCNGAEQLKVFRCQLEGRDVSVTELRRRARELREARFAEARQTAEAVKKASGDLAAVDRLLPLLARSRTAELYEARRKWTDLTQALSAALEATTGHLDKQKGSSAKELDVARKGVEGDLEQLADDYQAIQEMLS